MRDLRVWRPEGLHWRVRPWLWLFFEPRHRFTCSQKPHCTCLFRNTHCSTPLTTLFSSWLYKRELFSDSILHLGLKIWHAFNHRSLVTVYWFPSATYPEYLPWSKCSNVDHLFHKAEDSVCSLTTRLQERSADIGFLKGLEAMDFINEGCQIASASLSFLDRTYSW